MPQVQLIRRNDKVSPSFNIGITLDRKETKGQVGIEIEVEGENLPKADQTPEPWGYHIDHSLRGKENGEYVLNFPIDFNMVPEALKNLWDVFDKMGSKFDDSNRTSVHVHLNCQTFHMNRLTSFLAAWFSLEEILVEWCGEHRVGNLFCLRAVDAPAIINCIRKFIRTDGQYPIGEIFHYAGMNPHALHKYGSLEVRTLRGCSDPKIIENWIGILERLYDISGKYEDPRELTACFSSGGPLSFFDLLLGDKAQIVREGVGLTNQQISDAVFRGIRFAQDLCFCRDWDAYTTMKLRPDPFGRNPKKVAQKMMEEQMVPTSGSSVSNTQNAAYLEAVTQIYSEPEQDEPDTFDPFNTDAY